MDLYFDNITGALTTSLTSAQAVTTITVKRGDTRPLSVYIHQGGELVSLPPGSLGILVARKTQADPILLQSPAWTAPAQQDGPYRIDFLASSDLVTTEIGTDPDLRLKCEFTRQNATTAAWLTSPTFELIILNDLFKGNEPAPALPDLYPLAELPGIYRIGFGGIELWSDDDDDYTPLAIAPDLGPLATLAAPGAGAPDRVPLAAADGTIAWGTAYPASERILYADRTGNNATAVPGHHARPYLTAQAIWDAAVALVPSASAPVVIALGIAPAGSAGFGNIDINALGASRSPYIHFTGLTPALSTLGTIDGNGHNITIQADHRVAILGEVKSHGAPASVVNYSYSPSATIAATSFTPANGTYNFSNNNGAQKIFVRGVWQWQWNVNSIGWDTWLLVNTTDIDQWWNSAGESGPTWTGPAPTVTLPTITDGSETYGASGGTITLRRIHVGAVASHGGSGSYSMTFLDNSGGGDYVPGGSGGTIVLDQCTLTRPSASFCALAANGSYDAVTYSMHGYAGSITAAACTAATEYVTAEAMTGDWNFNGTITVRDCPGVTWSFQTSQPVNLVGMAGYTPSSGPTYSGLGTIFGQYGILHPV